MRDSLKGINRRQCVSALLIISLVMTLFIYGGTNVNAASPDYATGKINAKSGAIVRSGTGTSSKNKAILKLNTSVKIQKEVFIKKTSIKKTHRWYKIKTPSGQTGYIRSDLIKNIKYSKSGGTVTSGTKYYKGAGTKMKKAGSLKKDDKVDVVLAAKASGSDALWYKIKKNSKYYYVKSDAVEIEGSDDDNLKIDNDDSEGSKSVTADGVEFVLSDIRYPDTIAKGSPFSIMGTIRSEKKMSRLDAVVADSSGKWVISSGKDLSGTKADLADLDSGLKFGKLKTGKFFYKAVAVVNGRKLTVFSHKFTVKAAKRANKITKKAFELAWPEDTSSSKYNYGSGKATDAYKKALDEVYPGRKWGKAPQVGASCDVFVGTVLRSSGVAKDCPRGLDDQGPYFENSGLFTRIAYNGDHSVLRTGDVILYKHPNGMHVCIYVVRNGRAYIAEANYKHTYGRLETSESGINYRLNPSGKKWIKVYRINE